jgi:hypothetical protein
MMKLSGVFLTCLFCSFPAYLSAVDSPAEALRIGGLDFPATSFGAIRIDTHENPSKDETERFANYYYDLSTWVGAKKETATLLSDGDDPDEERALDWYNASKLDVEELGENEFKYTTVYRDNRSMTGHEPIGIEIKQELYYKRGRDWAILILTAKNISNTDLQDFYLGLKLDADVPDEENKPTSEDDLVSNNNSLIALYDAERGKERSNVAGLAPLGDAQALMSWWSRDDEPLLDSDRSVLVKNSRTAATGTEADYRIMASTGPFSVGVEGEVVFVCGLVESEGLAAAEVAHKAASVYYEVNIASGLRDALKKQSALVQRTMPAAYQLFANYPNPFNPTTTISYALPEAEHVELSIFNLQGKLVARIVDAEQPAGFHSATWDSRDRHGNRVSSGVYYYRLETGKFVDTRKMILLQ